MKIYNATNPVDFDSYSQRRIRQDFLVESIFESGKLLLNYSHNDRIIFGGASPIQGQPINIIGDYKELRAAYFLERREMGVINLGGSAVVTIDNVKYTMNKLDCLYVGMGSKNIVFESVSHDNALLYICTTPAHKTYPTTLKTHEDAIKTELGSASTCNLRTIYKYILPQGIKSCQLVMGITILKDGSVWNTMPTHTHDRRMEVYLYTDIKPEQVVMHFMGEPVNTKHIVVRNNQAVISPSWSIHSGVGTQNYSFVWAMCGENQEFDDMDFVKMNELG